MKESLGIICASSDYCDIYIEFEKVYYSVRYVDPKVKINLAKWVYRNFYLNIYYMYMSCVLPEINENKIKETDKSYIL